jgi:hypothetical protein
MRENSMLLLYVLSGIIAYAHKIPLIGKIITLASLYYGRTTWWKILIKIRKLFIIFNAIIGVVMVFNTVGFSFDHILAGFTGMGHTYLEIFYNFSKRIFNWFIELFDHKIVPNTPSSPSSRWTNYNKNNLIPEKDPLENTKYIRNLLKDQPNWFDSSPSINVNKESTPWYKDLSTWLWFGGIICSVGAIYVGYKFITDPTFIETIFSTGSSSTVTPDINIDGTPSPDITLTDRISQGFVYVSSGIGSAYSYTLKKLNPLNWFNSTTDINNQFKIFMEKQNDMVRADRRFYPFTETNPFLPWYKQLKINLLGESVSESLTRFKDRTIAERIYNSLQVSKGKFTDVTAVTPLLTPTPNNWIGSVGINTPTIGTGTFAPSIGFNFFDHINSENLQNRLNSLTPTPNNNPTLSDANLNDIGGSAKDWINQENANKIASSSKVKLDDIPATPNKFDVLELENI